MPGVKPGHGCGKMRSSRRSVFVDVDEGAAPPLLLHVALDLIHLDRSGTAGLEQPQERLLSAHRHPLGNKGLAICGQAVDAPAVAVHEVDQGAHPFSFSSPSLLTGQTKGDCAFVQLQISNAAPAKLYLK
jgi:hypothetical protein